MGSVIKFNQPQALTYNSLKGCKRKAREKGYPKIYTASAKAACRHHATFSERKNQTGHCRPYLSKKVQN